MSVQFLDLTRVFVTTTGTVGTANLGTTVAGFLSFSAAGAVDGMTYRYSIMDPNGQSEIGTGVYSAAGNSITRNPTKSTNSNNRINLSGTAQLIICLAAEDLFVTIGGTNIFLNAGNVPVIAGNFGIGAVGTVPDSLLTVNANTAATPGSLPAGTTSHVVGAAATNARILIDTFASPNSFLGRRADGTISSPTAIQLNEPITSFAAYGYGSTGYSSTSRANISMFAAENWTDTAQGTLITFSTTAAGGSTTLTERMRIDSTGFVNIGPALTPDSLLTVNANTAATPGSLLSGTVVHVVGASGGVPARVVADAFGNGVTFNGRRADGTISSPTAVQLNEAIVGFGGIGYGATGYPAGNRAAMNMFAAENWSDTAQGTYINFFTTSTGSTTILERMRIDSTGFVNIGPGLTPVSLLTVNANTGSPVTAPPSFSVATLVGADSSNAGMFIFSYGGNPLLTTRRADGTQASKTAVVSNDVLFQFSAQGWDSSTYGVGPFVIFAAQEDWSTSAHGSYISFIVVTPTTTTFHEAMRIFGSGGVSIGNTTDPGTAGYLSVAATFSPAVYGGTAANAILDLSSTNNGSPSGDLILLRASNTYFQSQNGVTTFAQFNSTGIGVGATPLNKLDVAGGVAIGSYAGVSTAPTNGLIVSGSVLVGLSTPDAVIPTVPLQIFNNILISGLTQSDLIQKVAGAATNEKYWDIFANGTGTAGSGILEFRLVNDAFSSAPIWMQVTRNTTTPTGLSFGASAFAFYTSSVGSTNILDYSGSTANTWSFHGTGGVVIDTATMVMLVARSTNTGSFNVGIIQNTGTASTTSTSATWQAALIGGSQFINLTASGGAFPQGQVITGSGMTGGFLAETVAGPIIINPHTTLQFLSAGSPVGDFGLTANTWSFHGTGGVIIDTATGIMLDVISTNTGGTNAVYVQNGGTPSNGATIAELVAILSAGTNAYIQMYALGGATPNGNFGTGAGLTGGLNIFSSAGAIAINAATTLQFQIAGSPIGDYGLTNSLSWTTNQAFYFTGGTNGIFGNSAAGGQLFIGSTSSGSPSGDLIAFRASNFYFQNVGGSSTFGDINVSNSGAWTIGSSVGLIVNHPTTFTGAATRMQITAGESSNNSAYGMTMGFALIGGTTWTGFLQATAGGVVGPLVINSSSLQFSALGAGLLTSNSSGLISSNTSLTTATTPGNFVANRYLPVNVGGTTFYIPLSTGTW